MNQRKRTIKPFVNLLISIIFPLVHAGIFTILWYTVFNPGLMMPYEGRGSYLVIAMFFCILYFLNSLFGGSKIGYYKRLDCIVAQTISLLGVYMVEYVMISLMSYRFISPLPILSAVLFGFLFNIGWTYLVNALYQWLNPPREILLIYGRSPIEEVYDKINARRDKYNIVKRVSYKAGEEQLKQEIAKYEAVILHDLSAQLRNHLIKYCYERSIRVYVTPKLYDILIRGASDMDLFDTPFLLMRNNGLNSIQTLVKRGMDIAISLILILIFLPLMLVIAAAIKLCDRGPVFYKQTRLTKDGKEFQILKFRSMNIDAEKNTIRLMGKNDNRVTKIGRILRCSHMDEIPQLFNILCGEMSLVGPRPERPEIASVYEMEIPEFNYRLKVKAGLTGYAQVYGKYNSTPYDKLKLDLMYIQNYSLLMDIRLLLLTGKTLFIPDHAEGIVGNMSTALRSSTDTIQKNMEEPGHSEQKENTDSTGK